MKTIALVISLSLSFIYAEAQKFDKYFLKYNYEEYKGCLLKVVDNKADAYFYNAFYKGIPARRVDKELVVDKQSELKNRVFRVDSTFTHTYLLSDNSKQEGIFLKLKDINNGQVLYYKYDKSDEDWFVFLVAELKINDAIIAKDIIKDVDKFSGETTFMSPYYDNARILKKIAKGKTQYYLVLTTSYRSVTYNNRGVYIVFTDGKKWQRPAQKVDVDYDETFDYSAYILLTPQDLLLFQSKNIDAFRLNIYDEELSSVDSERFKHYVAVIKNMK